MNEFLASLERLLEKTAFKISTRQIYTITRKIVVSTIISKVTIKIVIKRQEKDSLKNHLYFCSNWFWQTPENLQWARLSKIFSRVNRNQHDLQKGKFLKMCTNKNVISQCYVLKHDH